MAWKKPGDSLTNTNQITHKGTLRVKKGATTNPELTRRMPKPETPTENRKGWLAHLGHS